MLCSDRLARRSIYANSYLTGDMAKASCLMVTRTRGPGTSVPGSRLRGTAPHTCTAWHNGWRVYTPDRRPSAVPAAVVIGSSEASTCAPGAGAWQGGRGHRGHALVRRCTHHRALQRTRPQQAASLKLDVDPFASHLRAHGSQAKSRRNGPLWARRRLPASQALRLAAAAPVQRPISAAIKSSGALTRRHSFDSRASAHPPAVARRRHRRRARRAQPRPRTQRRAPRRCGRRRAGSAAGALRSGAAALGGFARPARALRTAVHPRLE